MNPLNWKRSNENWARKLWNLKKSLNFTLSPFPARKSASFQHIDTNLVAESFRAVAARQRLHCRPSGTTRLIALLIFRAFQPKFSEEKLIFLMILQISRLSPVLSLINYQIQVFRSEKWVHTRLAVGGDQLHAQKPRKERWIRFRERWADKEW